MTTSYIRDRVFVITGGSSGIGFAVARQVVDEGGYVALLARSQSGLDRAAAALGSASLTVSGSVTCRSDLDGLMSAAMNRWGRIDAVIANAGVARFQPIEEVTDDMMDLHLDVNVKGSFLTVQRALRHMPSGGAIVLVSSNAHRMGVATAALYSASKGALRSMGRSLAAELAPRGIRVNVVSPGPTDTPIFESMGLSREHLIALRAHMQQRVPLKRIANPEEIARTVVFLASDESSFVTGEELCVDGGWIALG